MDDRLIDCKKALRCVIGQANLFDGDSGECFEKIPVPDDLESCESMMIEIIKGHTRDQKYENENYPVPVYFAGWLGPYEAAFEYLVEYGLAKWRNDGWEQMIILNEND
jgi:hypothetical protein